MPPGGHVTITGGGFKPGSTAQIILHSDVVVLNAVTADGSGVVAATVSIPPNTAAGVHTLEIRGGAADGSTRSLSAAITVATLPRTGSGSTRLLVWSLVVAIAGAAGVWFGRPQPLKHGIRR